MGEELRRSRMTGLSREESRHLLIMTFIFTHLQHPKFIFLVYNNVLLV